MPLISPILSAQLRRHWQLMFAVLVFAVFIVVHLLVFQPAAHRYHLALKRAGDLGLAVETEAPPPLMPPRVLALIVENALPATAAGMERESGALTAGLLEDLTQLTTRHGLQVLATEPGITAQEAQAIQVRAHLKIRCSFSEFVAFVDDMSRSNRLIAIDRFDLVSDPPGEPLLDLWVTRYIIKQPEGPRRS
ncbi:MAG TPA: type 4a pilus biogenesis protein PilO [Candidatus Eisenbacteria bacterium]|nr:type 4a pilus biogenesis protein PilO [Candidatus Eisenbacteria bacterium]